jgi:hypothetical protein
MTEQVRKRYRNHRTTIWAGVLAVLLIALAAVPLATGANSKYYTLGVSPANACSVPTEQTFTLILTNQTRTQNLGSANITAPSYIALEPGTQGISGTTYSSFTVNQPDSFDSTLNTIRLRGLNLPTTGSAATITVKAQVSVPAAGTDSHWTSIVKQSNTFADSGPGNLFALSGLVPATTVSACHYAFVQGPVNAQKNAAQTVKVQLQTSSGLKVDGSGDLTLSAYQGIDSNTQLAPAPFTGLTSTASSGEWSFSVVGAVSGQDYSLKANTARSSYFAIADCIPTNGTCNVGFTDNGDGTGGGAFSGSGLTAGSGIVLSFETIPASGAAICNAGWGWSPLTFPPQPPDGRTNFDGITLGTFSFSKTTGFMKATTYLRNDLFVLSSPNQTNDIQVCAGAAHSNPSIPNGPPDNAFMGRNSTKAQWDPVTSTGGTNLYWGVLARIPNCNKAPDLNNDGILDPALCGWGTWTDPNTGILYRTATVLIPYDWDWKGGY